MDTLYNGVVDYERMKSYVGSFITGIIGIAMLIWGLFSYASSLSSPPPSQNKDNKPAESEPSNSWIFLSVLGIIFSIISAVLYYIATDTSKTTENILAAKGAFDITSSIFKVFRRKGGYFDKGE
jgi:drug/metabolite transporter (DMT)-like permease